MMEPVKSDDFVSVAIRIRPHISQETSHGSCINVLSTDPAILRVSEKPQCYAFDHIFAEESEQHQVYDEIVKPMVDRVIDGYNSTVFAYGHTGTGKTYTIGTDIERYVDKDDGLITRTLIDILNQNDENKLVSISISFCEIYNEKVYDLLDKNKTALTLKGLQVLGLSIHPIMDVYKAKQLLLKGGKNRHIGETRQNSNSSRSHAIFTIYCNVKHLNHEVESKLNLVDLAGSESIKKTGNEGSQLFEGININKGLLCIGQVINALSSNQQFVPYRQSTITTMLQVTQNVLGNAWNVRKLRVGTGKEKITFETRVPQGKISETDEERSLPIVINSLNKNNYVALIACVVPNVEDAHETTQTLEFAQSAKRVRSRPELNIKMVNASRTATVTPSVRYTFSGRKRLGFKTPYKVCSTPLPQRMARRPAMSDMDHFDCESHLSVSTTSSNAASDYQINLSPIVRKCVDAVQNNIMDKLQSLMAETMSKSVIPQTPSVYQAQFITSVTDIVRKELQQIPNINCSVLNENGNGFVNGVNNGGSNQIEKSPGSLRFNEGCPVSAPQDISPIFKVPEMLPNRIRKVPPPSVETSSPVENKTVRRSLRLSLKRSLTTSPIETQTPRTAKISLVNRTSTVPVTPVPKPRTNPPKQTPSGRNSKPPIPAPRKIQTKLNLKNIRNVLYILNNGGESDFLRLHTIGKKSANMLFEFRKLKGSFTKITDLRGMPWRGKGFQRFLKANFLTDS